MPPHDERERIKKVYAEYVSKARFRRRWRPGPAMSFIVDGKWSAVQRCLAGSGLDRARARVLDIGSATGHEIPHFAALGFQPAGIVCVDLRADAVRGGRARNTGADFLVADARLLPFADGEFDVVHQSVMVSSILDVSIRRAVVQEMGRTTKTGGCLIWYDTRYRNPFNPHTRPVTRRELLEWLPDFSGTVTSATLLPPLARALAPVSLTACRILERVPPFRSHLLAVLRKDR